MVKKICTKCGESKFIIAFNTRPDRPSGYRSECKKCQYRSQHINHKRLPKVFRAYNKLHYAQKLGLIIKPDKCEKCHKVKVVQGHHPDYDNPLEVEWLCSKCHRLAG